MIRRTLNRLRATFRGPSSYDLAAMDAAVHGEVQRLAAEVTRLRNEVALLRADIEPFHVRPGTLDAAIYAEVVHADEYRLPIAFAADDAILDIGAHIGSFAFACLKRGAGRVVAYEPVPANHAMLLVNLTRFGPRAEARRAAVWRSDGPATTLQLEGSDDASNTGGGRVAEGTGACVPAVPFDTVVLELLAATKQPRLRLLKLDCEGSEYPVLLTATCLHLIDAVCGEYHEVRSAMPAAQVHGRTEYGRDELVACLEAAGFRVETEENPRQPGLGLFWARRD